MALAQEVKHEIVDLADSEVESEERATVPQGESKLQPAKAPSAACFYMDDLVDQYRSTNLMSLMTPYERDVRMKDGGYTAVLPPKPEHLDLNSKVFLRKRHTDPGLERRSSAEDAARLAKVFVTPALILEDEGDSDEHSVAQYQEKREILRVRLQLMGMCEEDRMLESMQHGIQACFSMTHRDQATLVHHLLQAHRAEFYFKATRDLAAEIQEIELRRAALLYLRIKELDEGVAEDCVWRAAAVYKTLLNQD